MADKNPKIYTVSELNGLAQKLLEENFSTVWLEGEISNFRGIASSGHCYFSLKDENSQIELVAFRSVMNSLKFRLEDGLKVLVQGRISLYTQRGRFQMIANLLEPKGAGALALAFEQLKKKLEAEGLFDLTRKKAIPSLPQKIGIVTSPQGAALKDMLTIINRRFANVEILIYPVKVQGVGAKEEIEDAIRTLNENYKELDVLLVGRGGGSIEDLWAFNEECVARAIAGSKIPIISCVGHEIDFTIADFVADLRAPTPSAAAELVVKNKIELQNQLINLHARLKQNIFSCLEFAFEQIKGFARTSLFTRPQILFENNLQNLDDLFAKMDARLNQSINQGEGQLQVLKSKLCLLSPSLKLEEKMNLAFYKVQNLENTIQKKIQQLKESLHALAGKLEALSPLAVLSRGYAIAYLQTNNKIIKSSLQVVQKDLIRVKLHQGEITASVQDIN
ncbi:MAG: exodeoxyribonuclease VII large subunit [Elusimicrobia bacterium]|nr:exodeoxyribonuclease VII large subunit [Elusimicrobiota bacterium]